ncbi:MAG: DMT family transporter [Gammaproteobacteria bacterium]
MLGIALRIVAIACFALMAAMIKLGHQAGASTVELVFYRSLFGLPPLLVWIAATRNFGAWRTDRPLAHVWRGAIGLTAMSLGFAALGYLPLAEATTISFAVPLFAIIISALFLHEKVGAHRWSAVAAGFLGVLVVTQPEGDHLPLAGLILAVLGAFAAAIAHITVRQIGRTDGTQTIVLWFGVITLLAAGALMPFYGQMHGGRAWLILFALGFMGGAGQIFLTASLRYARVSVVVPFDYLQLLWAVVLGWLVFAEQPPATTWAGATVIIASGLYTIYREHKLGRENAREAPPL